MLSTIIDLLLPPTSLALLVLLALLFHRPRRRRPWLPTACAAALLLLAMPITSEALLAALEPDPVPPGAPPAAIVILSADVDRLRDGTGDIGAVTLERERAGAALARRTGLPVLVTGGLVNVPPRRRRPDGPQHDRGLRRPRPMGGIPLANHLGKRHIQRAHAAR